MDQQAPEGGSLFASDPWYYQKYKNVLLQRAWEEVEEALVIEFHVMSFL